MGISWDLAARCLAWTVVAHGLAPPYGARWDISWVLDQVASRADESGLGTYAWVVSGHSARLCSVMTISEFG